MADPGKLNSHGCPVALDWAAAMQFVAAQARVRGLRGLDVVVLVPYAQLIHVARSAWVLAMGAGLLPRFESTLNWTRALGMLPPQPEDIRFDAALDAFTARALLARSGQSMHLSLLGPRVMAAAWSLAGAAAAIEPAHRQAWGMQMAAKLAGTGSLFGHSPLLALEAVVARVAVAWAAHSAYATDVLFDAKPGLLVVLEGFQIDPVTAAVQARLGDRCVRWPLAFVGNEPVDQAASRVRLHPALDAEDEARRSAACVMAHLGEGRSPVALVALDRQLTRRVRALLSVQGVSIRDETGWKLSTTRAAATLMSLLRAAAPDARPDDVLDWLKNAPKFENDQIKRLEQILRQRGLKEWAMVSSSLPLVGAVNAIRVSLQHRQSASDFLRALQVALQDCGVMDELQADVAGVAVLQALHLHADTEYLARTFTAFGPAMSLSDFIDWVTQTLESTNHMPPHPAEHQVLILPMAQLLGRDVSAVVLAGCDEARLQPSPEPPDHWTPAQRLLLGLPSRESLALAHHAAWRHALRVPRVDVVWRSSDLGEPASPSPWVQLLELGGAQRVADPCSLVGVPSRPLHMPSPNAAKLSPGKLSASAYADLRQCPYKFFALRQLGLSEDAELDETLDKRDFGNWLHQVLHVFHEDLLIQSKLPQAEEWAERLDAAATLVTRQLALSDADFLPFAASWPQVRDGYLSWLVGHAKTGAQYSQGEAWREVIRPLTEGAVTLVGKLDRMDCLTDGTRLLIDYKTESSAKTAARIKAGTEDTQLAFYAALFPGQAVSAAYLNVGERGDTEFKAQPDILLLREALMLGIENDLNRIAAGAPLPAMGDGTACAYCAARGLCRKDQWA